MLRRLALACILTALWAAPYGCAVDTTAIGLEDSGTPMTDSGPGFDAGMIGTFPFIVIVTEPSGMVSGDALIEFRLYDSDVIPVDVAATYDFGGTLSIATPSPGSNLLFGVTADPEKGRLLTFVWNSAQDVPGDVDGVSVCFQGMSDSGLGNLACTTPFDVRNGDPGAAFLKINEVDTGDEDAVELVNTGPDPVDVSGYIFTWTDDSNTFDDHILPDGTIIGPGELLLLRENVGPTNIAGLVYLGSNINWSGLTGGSAAFLDQVGNGIDFVRWGGSTTPPDPPAIWTESGGVLPTVAGGDITLSRVAPDTDDAADWCLTLPTLWSANDPCLVFQDVPPGDLVINEMATGIPDWVEVVNTSGGSIELLGMRLQWTSPMDGGLFTLPAYLLPPGGRVVIMDDQGAPGPGIIVGQGNIGWGAFVGGGSVTLTDGNGNPVDFVRWGMDMVPVPSGLTFDDSMGNLPTIAETVTLGRIPDGMDTDSALDFCVTENTEGVANTACLPDSSSVTLILTEIGVGIPDWVEVTNVGATTADLLGWRFIWQRPPGGGGFQAGILSMPAYSLAPGERVVIADDTLGLMNELVFTGFVNNIRWGGMAGFGGAAGLYDPPGNNADYVLWGTSAIMPFPGVIWSEPGGGIPAPGGNPDTVNRDETVGDNDVDTDWCIKMGMDTAGLPNDTCP